MKCEHARSRTAEILAFVMVLAASLALELVTVRTHGWDRTHLNVTIAWTALALIVYAGLSWWGVRRIKPLWATGGLIAAMLVSLLVRRLAIDQDKMDLPLELLLLTALRDAALTAAAMGCSHRTQRVAASSSLAVAVLAFSLGSGGWLFAAMLVCLVAGAGWLMAGCWLDTQGRAIAATRVTVPWFPLITCCCGTILLVLAAAIVYPDEVESLEVFAMSWHKLSPKSLNAFHRSRKAFRSPFQTMADLTDLKYGSAEGGGEFGAGAAAGPGSGAVQGSLAQMVESGFIGAGGQRAVRRFSIVRSGPAVEIPKTIIQQALFQTSRQLPLHMPVTTYDRFDGKRWRPEESFLGPRMASQLFDGKGQTTIFSELPFSLDPQELAEAEARAEAAARADGAGDIIDQARREAARMLAQWGGGGRVVEPEIREMTTRHLSRLLTMPANGEVLESQYLITPYDLIKLTEQLQKDPKLLARFQEAINASKEEKMQDVMREYLHWRCEQGSVVLPSEIQRLLTKWTAGKRPGWEQIEAVILGLRSHCRHDPQAVVPENVLDPTFHFLLRSRRGPDYLFASTAVVLLRGLGYRARMVGGFYARPEDRSFWTGRSAVHGDDVHYWAQARLGDGTWVDLEPTPGYDMPRAEVPWSEWAADLVHRASQWSLSFQESLVVLLAVFVAAFALRRRIADRLATFLWRTRLLGNANRAVLATWRLIERRARLVRRPRRPGTTLQTWAGQLLVHRPEAIAPLVELADLADWATHAPGGLESRQRHNRADVRALCRSAASSCTMAQLRAPTMTSRARSARPFLPSLPTRGLPDDSHQHALLLRRRRRRSPHRLAARCT